MMIRNTWAVMIGVLALSACSVPSAINEAPVERQSQSNALLAATTQTTTSPDGRTVFAISDEGGSLHYTIERSGDSVIARSRLGLRFENLVGLDENLRIISADVSSQNQTWDLPWGERARVTDHHNELLVRAERISPTIKFNIRIRVFDDGVGFRYEMPEQNGVDAVTIIDELTEFSVDETAESWWIPARKWNRYEYLYEKTPVPEIDMVHTPVTMKLPSGTHISLHEAALIDYSGMSLERGRGGTLKANLAPHADGALVKTRAPFQTPWRTVQISDDAPGLMNSDMILNLNAPNTLGDTSYFTPGKYVGIWWQMHMRDRSWGQDTIHGATTEETIRFMDFAAKYGFDGVLVEGWNTGWDGDWFNNGDVFSFTQTYPDFDIEAVAAHGRDVGVRLIGHHETSGNITNYENQLEDALDLYAANDVALIKTGYVADGGDIKRIDENGIAKYEYHDGQIMVDHHLKVVQRAAEHKIAINPHEPVKDTGLRRTYPNWVSREGARGQEFNAWGVPPNGPDHVLNLAFTRMLSGPMDYTAGAFNLRPSEIPPLREDMPRNDPRSRIEHTLAKELSLYVALYSPIQMVMDLPKHYEARPDAFQFIIDVPTDWDDSRALAGAVGDYLIMARKDKHSPDWYAAALTDENARELTLDLAFLGEGEYEAQIYRDGEAADYDTNPYDIVIESRTVRQSGSIDLKLARSGGAAIRFRKIEP